MPTHDSERMLARRSFFSKFGFGLLGGAAAGAAAAPLQAQSAEGSRFDAMRHAQDDWLDLPGKHRYIFDAPNPDGFAIAIQFTTTYYNINVNDYGLKDSDIAVVLVARHLLYALRLQRRDLGEVGQADLRSQRRARSENEAAADEQPAARAARAAPQARAAPRGLQSSQPRLRRRDCDGDGPQAGRRSSRR